MRKELTTIVGSFIFILIFHSISIINAQRCRDEIPLPTNLDLIPRYEVSNELHLHGTHRVNLTKPTNISFTIREESYFRSYLAGDTFDVDLWLYKGSTWLDMSIIGPKREDMIAQKLDPASYILVVKPLGYDLSEDDKDPLKCHTILIEVAIAPVSRTMERINNYKDCPDGTFLPSVDFSPLQIGLPVNIDSDKDQSSRSYNVNTPPRNDSIPSFYNDVVYVKNFDFILSPKPGTDPLYQFRASVGYDFLTGGTVRIILAPQMSEVPNCLTYDSNCNFGKNYVSNKNTLLTTLGPGNYSLWIVDVRSEKLPGLPLCTPISFEVFIKQSTVKENFVSCHAELIPTSLTLPGYLDDTGYLHFHQDVYLDLGNSLHETKFIVRAPSLFRVFTEAHRVDIDLEVRSDTTTLARTYSGNHRDESIILELEPNVEYSIFYHYYTIVDANFCETFLLGIAIEPSNDRVLQVDYCSGQTTKTPSMSLSPLLGDFQLPTTPYYHFYVTTTHVEPIFTIPISSPVAKVLNVRINVKFIMGLSLFLNNNGTTVKPITAQTQFNALELIAVILPDTFYTLELKSGPWQSGTPNNLNTFPQCIFYDMELSLLPVDLAPIHIGHHNCELPGLPSNLTGPQFFGTSNRVHFQQLFVIPRPQSGFESQESITFQVRQRSMFRAYTELSSDVQIGFRLTENDISLPHVITEEGAEKVSAILNPGNNYVFTTIFSTDFDLLPQCSNWNLEFEISPVQSGIISECPTVLPPQRLWIPTDILFQLNEQYAFVQNSTSFVHKIVFQTYQYTYLRAKISFDFVWSDLSIRVMDNNTLLAFGINGYNKNEISGLELAPGFYTLEIFEPEAQETDELWRCVEFSLMIGIAPIYGPNQVVVPSDFKGCMDTYFPSTFDSISFLSEISGNSMHFERDILVDTITKAHSTLFHIKVPSYFRIFVPPHDVDIDLSLDLMDDSSGIIDLDHNIAKSTGYAEEHIFEFLQVGLYRLSFRFLPQYSNGFFFPEEEDCVTFTAEIGVFPEDYTLHNLTTDPCSPPTLPTSLVPSTYAYISSSRPTTAANLSFSFTLTEGGLFTVGLSYVFVPGGLYMTLEGTGIRSPYVSAPTNQSWQAYTGKDLQFFDHVLWPGEYKLILSDRENFPVNRCTKFLLDYYIDEGNIPPNYCDDADKFPTDLYSEKGKSKFYGGPQNPDGSVRISGSRFLLPEKRSHTNIFFKIHNTSWVRIWTGSTDINTDIDFLLWKNSSRNNLIEASVGFTSIESRLTILKPQTEDYLLDIYIFDRSKSECTYASFEMSIELDSSAAVRARCPSPLPNPSLPPKSVILSGDSKSIFSTDFLFSKDFMDSHKQDYWGYSLVTYDMTLIVQERDYNILAILGYDFTLTDFTISILHNNTVVAQSSYGVPEGAIDSFVDFEARLTGRVSPGNYTLRIQETLYKARNVTFGDCDRFAFALLADGIGIKEAPHVVSVIPPSGTDLEIISALEINLGFSEALGSDVPTSLIELTLWLQSNQVVYLLKYRDNSSVYPSNAYYNPSNNIMSIYFWLHFDSTYRLVINAPLFTSTNGTQFAIYNQLHTYTTISCSCGGHGRCDPNATHIRQCVCDSPYGGDGCKGCILGYHREGVTCVQNSYCTPDICNNHGNCHSDLGYPLCTCDIGYEDNATSFCAKCQAGYSGYPVCTPNTDDRITSCTAPIIPNDLNTITYLGIDGTVHIQGDYYLDTEHPSHSITFSLSKDSYFRIYTEPHAVDIDLWFWEVVKNDKGESELKYIDHGISYNKEESIFRKLDEGKDFQLDLKFLPTFTDVGPCPTFNLELSIEPVSLLQDEVGRYASDCGSSARLPQLSIDKIPPTGYKFVPDGIYSVRPESVNENGEFYSFIFEVEKVPSKMVLVQADLEYRFLTGDIAINLQRTDINGTKPITGFNHLNTHHLQHYLHEGKYKLTLYLPKSMDTSLNNCSPFVFRFEANFTSEEQDVFNCDYPRLPLSLESPPYRGNRVHVYGNFLVEEDRNIIAFTVQKPGSIRIQASSAIPLNFYLTWVESKDSYTILGQASNDGQILYTSIEEGKNYEIQIDYSALDQDNQFCPTVQVEIYIIPNLDLFSLQPNYNCPSGNVPHLPLIPEIPRLPYKFVPETNNITGVAIEELYYTFIDYGPTVAQYTFFIDTNVFIEVGVASHFLTGNLHLELLYSTGTITKSRSGQEDYNYIREEIPRGNYTLRIIQSNVPSSGSLVALIPCIPFSFYMNIVTVAAHTDTPCFSLNLDPLPTSLNNMRYLGIEHLVQLQSQKWAIPSFSTFGMSTHWMYFNTIENSIMRVYVAEHSIDIDVRLIKFVNGENTFVKSGSNLFGEESFVVTIPAGEYALVFNFIVGAVNEPSCPFFNMEMALSPVLSLPIIEPFCPSTMKEKWPSLPSSLELKDLPFLYDPTDDFYYQQVDHNEYTHALKKYNLVLHVAIDIHIELYYNFLLGDLVIQLSGGGMVDPIYGENEYHRNVLTAKNLPPGSYSLTIYEPTSNDPDIIGCNRFQISMHADVPSAIDTKVSSPQFNLPSTLDSIAYLRYTDRVHIQGDYNIVHNSPTNKVGTLPFTLSKQSLLRATVGIQSPFDMNLKAEETRKHPSILTSLDPGSYTLFFYLQDDRVAESVMSDLELAIYPMSALNSRILELPCKGFTTQWKVPLITPRPSDGYFQWRDKHAYLLHDQLTSPNDLYEIPFQLSKDIIFSVQLQYDFIISDLAIHISSQDSTLVDPTRYGKNRYNLDDIRVHLSSGNYSLIVQQTLPWPSSPFPDIPCTEFDLRITLSNVTSTDRVDCSAYSVLPWDLNTESGGSTPFGGPLLSGHLKLFYDRFLLNSDNKQLVSSFRIDQPTLVSVFITETSLVSIDFSITGSSMDSVMQPLGLARDWYQRVGLYILDSGEYFLRINYIENLWVTCSHFALGLAIDPITDVADYLSRQCDIKIAQKILPTSLSVGTTTINSYFTEQDIQSHTSNDGYVKFSISFHASSMDYLDVSFSYNSLVSLFTLTVYELMGTGENTSMIYKTTGEWDVVQDDSKGFYGLTQSISMTCWEAGDYVLTIQQPTLPKPDSQKAACIPYNFNFQLISSSGGPIIRHVEPPSGSALDPQRDLYIQIRFSNSIHTSTGNAITRSENTAILQNSIYLQMKDSKDSNDRIYAMHVLTPEDNLEPDDFTQWLLVFGHSKFKYGITYELLIEPSTLYDENNRPITMPTPHEYIMELFDVSCNGYGVYEPTLQICTCFPDSHRTGDQCDRCDKGYDMDKTGKCVLVEQCRADTCGCLLPAHPTDPCIPIGNCIDNPQNPLNRITCNCPPRYRGPRCEQCASGYGGYPKCDRACNPPCVHGTCDNTTLTCLCLQGFSGGACTESELAIPVKVIGGILFAVVILGVAGFLAWKWIQRRKETQYIDPSMELELEGGKKFGGGDDDSGSIGLDDDGKIEVPIVEDDSDDHQEELLS